MIEDCLLFWLARPCVWDDIKVTSVLKWYFGPDYFPIEDYFMIYFLDIYVLSKNRSSYRAKHTVIVWKLELVSAFLHPAQPRHHLLTSQKGQATSLISYRRVISDITGVLPSFIHSSTLAWQLLWMEEPGGLQSMGSLRVGHDWATSLSLFTFMHWRRKWQPTPVFLPGESQGRGSLVGCGPWGRTESDTTEVTWQQQQQQPSFGIFLHNFTVYNYLEGIRSIF